MCVPTSGGAPNRYSVYLKPEGGGKGARTHATITLPAAPPAQEDDHPQDSQSGP